MKKILLLSLPLLTACASFTQSIPPSSIEDSVLGWMKVYHFKGTKESKTVDDKTYSPAQLSLCDSFANWMQASYIPKGGLGDVRKAVSEKINSYNQYSVALPQSYGAYAKTYLFLKRGSNGKIEPATDHHLYWGVFANRVPGWPVNYLCTPSQYYFTMPSFESSALAEETAKTHDLTKAENVKPYISFWIKNIEAGNGTDYVLLCKENRSPFIKLTKGEYLQLQEPAIQRFYEEEKKKIYSQNKGNQKGIDNAIKYLEEKKERFTSCLKKNREKYSKRLEELALTGKQPSVYDLENRDIFSNGYLTDPESTTGRVPVYKIDPVMAELCKKDKPQWILINWWWTPTNAVEKHLHESIISNFNFSYVYNFFFSPDKVKGQPYKPLRSPSFKEAVVLTEPSENSKKNLSDKNIHFYEDFSTTGIGKKPIGWQTNVLLNGSGSTITKLDGADGNWVAIAGHTIKPSLLRKPLPQDFTLSYDLIASQDFKWGAYGLSMKLLKETSPGNAESFLKVKIRPGHGGNNGEVTIETKFPAPPGYPGGSKWLAAPGFSNNKKINRITVTIKKQDERLQVFIDKTKIADYEKAMPASHLFNVLSFDGGTTENDTFYITNIKITKE
jgi:hypothetical protein